MSDPVPRRLLYLGSGGHQGWRVVKSLVEAGDSNITASCRSPQKLSRFAGKVKAYFNDPTTLAAVLCRSRAPADPLHRWIGRHQSF